MKEDFVCGEDYRALVPNRKYEAVCIDYDQSFVMGKFRKLFLHFKITEPGEHYGKTVFMAFNMPYSRKIRQGSKYYKTYVFANGNKRPTRNSIMSPRIFKGRIFEIKTRTCEPKFPDGKPMPKHFRYSVVDSITRVL
jgi:hypothetical protein